MEVQFEKFLNQLIKSKPDGKILVAISGGVDSIVLAHLMRRCGKAIVWAHCNFGLRAEESDEDETFIRKFADDLHVQLFVKHFETSDYALQNKMSIQMAARELRYSWFQQLAKEQGCDFIAVAHHLDDQIETFFINLFRSSGIRGLSGMQSMNGNIIRPMLFAQRIDIENYANLNRLLFREDSSNSKNNYLRNNIRNQLLPLMYKLIDGSKSGMIQSLDYLSQNEILYKELVCKEMRDLLQIDENIVRIEKAKLLRFGALESILFECLSSYGFKGLQLQSILMALDSEPGATFLSSSHRLTINREWIEIDPVENLEIVTQYIVNKEDNQVSVPVNLKFSYEQNDTEFSLIKSPEIGYFDAEMLLYPFIIRKWKSGDRFIPFGMQGSKLLSDFFIDQHFTKHQKEKIWLLCDADDSILWVIGLRVSDNHKVTDQTKSVLKIQLDL